MERNILIIGFGVVGQAVHSGLSQSKSNYLDIVDLDHDDDIIYSKYDGVILCLPTPQGPTGECDDMLVEQYHRQIRLTEPDMPILIKSTISIELAGMFKDDMALTYNPEFLTQADSKEDFLHQKFAIFGGNNSRFWYYIYINSDIKIDKVRFTSIKNAAFAKYAINSFLATKVVFFNELRNLYSDPDFDSLTDIIGLDERIGTSHMMVPGPDLKYGFSGMCFPKDTSAFVTSAKRQGSPLQVLEKVIEVNKGLQ